MKRKTVLQGILAMFGSILVISVIFFIVDQLFGQVQQKTSQPEFMKSFQANILGSSNHLAPNAYQQSTISAKSTTWETIVNSIKSNTSVQIVFGVNIIMLVGAAVFAMYWMYKVETQPDIEDHEPEDTQIEEISTTGDKDESRNDFVASTTMIIAVLMLLLLSVMVFAWTQRKLGKNAQPVKNKDIKVSTPVEPVHKQDPAPPPLSADEMAARDAAQAALTNAFFANLNRDNSAIITSDFKPEYYSLSAAPVDPNLIPEIEAKPRLPYINDYLLEVVIGQGGQGVVWRVAKKDGSGQKFAMKETEIKPQIWGTTWSTFLTREAKVMKYFGDADPERFVRVHDYYVVSKFEKPRYLYIIMDFLDGKILDRLKTFGKETVAVVARELLKALHKMHSSGWRHRDVKPENVFITKDGHVKLLDLGMAGPLGEVIGCGTPEYLSPEISLKDIDGCVPYNTVKITTGGVEVEHKLSTDDKRKILQKCLEYEPMDIFSLGTMLIAMYPGKDDKDFNELMGLMRHLEPWKRPTAASLLNHPFITKNAPPGTTIDFNAV